MCVRSSRFLFLKIREHRRKAFNLARKAWGQPLGGGNIEGDLERPVGIEGCGINTRRAGVATVCVEGRRRMGSDQTGVGWRRSKAWKFRCFWNGWWSPDVEEPQNTLILKASTLRALP